jgi:hypothetical protein
MVTLTRGLPTQVIARPTLQNARILHATNIKALTILDTASFVLTTHILVLFRVAIIKLDKKHPVTMVTVTLGQRIQITVHHIQEYVNTLIAPMFHYLVMTVINHIVTTINKT